MLSAKFHWNILKYHPVAIRSPWVFAARCCPRIKDDRTIKSVPKQTIFLFTTLPESTRNVQKLVLAFFYLDKELTLVPATTFTTHSVFDTCLACADLMFTKITLKTDVDRSGSIGVKWNFLYDKELRKVFIAAVNHNYHV